MGKPMYGCGTQVKERARQQKQIGKASKRILARQKKAYIKTSPPNADSDIAEPIFAEDIIRSTDLPITSLNKKGSQS
jgi:hypothetical protein